jgi:hypothetical protein
VGRQYSLICESENTSVWRISRLGRSHRLGRRARGVATGGSNSRSWGSEASREGGCVVYSQGLGTYTVLQRKGIPSKLLFFPDENHWALKPANLHPVARDGARLAGRVDEEVGRVTRREA